MSETRANGAPAYRQGVVWRCYTREFRARSVEVYKIADQVYDAVSRRSQPRGVIVARSASPKSRKAQTPRRAAHFEFLPVGLFQQFYRQLFGSRLDRRGDLLDIVVLGSSDFFVSHDRCNIFR